MIPSGGVQENIRTGKRCITGDLLLQYACCHPPSVTAKELVRSAKSIGLILRDHDQAQY